MYIYQIILHLKEWLTLISFLAGKNSMEVWQQLDGDTKIYEVKILVLKLVHISKIWLWIKCCWINHNKHHASSLANTMVDVQVTAGRGVGF